MKRKLFILCFMVALLAGMLAIPPQTVRADNCPTSCPCPTEAQCAAQCYGQYYMCYVGCMQGRQSCIQSVCSIPGCPCVCD